MAFRALSNITLTAAIAMASLLSMAPALADIQFENVTAQSGISYSGRSFGASWGDTNADGWPDAWTGNHRKLAHLYINNKDGSFTEIFGTAWTNPLSNDGHGSAFADIDNDGDHDLIQLSGGGAGHGSSPNLLLINDADTFTNRAGAAGISLPLSRGRTPLWLDWNFDGQLDLLVANLQRSDGQAPTKVYLQQGGVFQATNIPGDTALNAALFAQLSDVLDVGTPMVILANDSVYPSGMYTLGDPAAVNQRSLIGFPVTDQVRDVAIADFDGDTRPDFFMSTMETFASDAEIVNGNSVRAAFRLSGEQQGVDFQTAGAVKFDFAPSWEVAPGRIFIGANGYHPGSTSFQLSPTNPANQGLMSHTAGSTFGYYISYVPATGTWRVRASKGSTMRANMEATSQNPIHNLVKILGSRTAARNDRLIMNPVTGFVDGTAAAGLSGATSCESVAAGDFDNDMDVDLYLVCASMTSNQPNILYENMGNAVFQAVEEAGGATGQSTGRGDSVATADFDNDGYLDLLVTNGSGEPPFTDNGSTELFRNVSSGNSWISLELQGVVSNRDGISARVFATAGGVTQLREQNNGVHRFAQNHQRLHFGLAANERVDLRIEWPSGTVDEHLGVPASAIYRAIEGGDIAPR